MSSRARTTAPATTDVAVIGGGIIGLAVAWRARTLGLDVTVLDRDRAGGGAARVAAGMLAPVAEVEFGAAGLVLLELGSASARMWPAFAAELQDRSGVQLELSGSETLYVARDADEAAELKRQLEFRSSLGLPVRRLRASEAREREPALAPTIRMALTFGGERTVDPRRVLDALRAACLGAGVRVRDGVEVEVIEVEGQGVEVEGVASDGSAGGGPPARPRVAAVRLRGGERLAASVVVLAAGARASDVAMLGGDGGPAGAARPSRPVVRPVKGQILRLRDPAGPGLLTGVVRFVGGYLVPRGDGRYALGATVEDRGFDAAPTAGAVHQLLCDARELVPGIDELEVEELCVGFRPGTPDNLPLLGDGAAAGLLWAGGHYRNGVLLTPLTAELLAGLIAAHTGAGAAPATAPATPATGPMAQPAAPGNGLLDDARRERMLAACAPGRFAAPAPTAAPGVRDTVGARA